MHYLDIPEVRTRAARIGLTLKQIALSAGVSQSTIAPSRRLNPRLNTMRKVNDALLAAEVAALERLVELHPETAHSLVMRRFTAALERVPAA